jgi:hypothetical protein
MLRFLRNFPVIILIGFCSIASSQNEAKKWYFGNNCALDFSTNPPTSVGNGTMSTWEGCASAADASGNLLFYTNGVKIWNRSHQVMDNGTGLAGNNSSSQSALIVKQPGNSFIYFVFTTDGGPNGLTYSVVDMSLASGMGSVTVKNSVVSASSTERLCGTKHCNSTDIWVISHDNYSNVFRANLVTSAGVNTTAVLSTTGSFMTPIGCMKASPNGKKLGAAIYSSSSFELYDFNTSTGAVSNPINLPVNAPAYGCEFSPDGTKFYGTLWAASTVTYRLRQWDLCAGSPQAIRASVSSFNATHTGQLQLGPDGKIYQARAVHKLMKTSPETVTELMYGEPLLGVIHNPNDAAALVNFNNTGQSVSPALSMFGLPNFVSGFYKTPVAKFTYSMNPAENCVKTYFNSPPLINATCSATSYTITSVKWLFGDPASGAANSSTLINPQHTYPDVGTYNVRLVLYNTCGGVIDTLRQQVAVSGALANQASDFSICSGQSLILTAAGSSAGYSWNTGSTASSIIVAPSSNTTYSVSYTDFFGCLHRSVQTVTVSPLPTLSVSAWRNDSVCEGATVNLRVSGAVTYSWSTGATNSTINVTPSVTTTYTIRGTSFNGCSVNKLVPVVIKPAPVPVIIANTLVCAGSTATAVAVDNGNASYSWNNGTPGATLTVVPHREQFVFSVTAKYNNGCSRFQKIRFNIQPLPVVSVAGNTMGCDGAVVTQTASGASTYSWSNGVTKNPASLVILKNTTYTVTGADTNNCVGTATVAFTVKPAPNASVSAGVSICEGERVLISASGGQQYQWEPASLLDEPWNNTVAVSPSVSTVYSVTVTADNCGTSRTVEVLVNPRPAVWAGRDTLLNPTEPMFITASGTGSVTWIGGDNIACPVCPGTQIFPIRNTCYIAQAVSDSGCSATDEVCVDITRDFAVYMPNTFTPDGDGLNDEFG